MLTNAALFILGLVLLTGGAELLVRGASRLALSFGLSPLVVGLTIVAFGTSAPEIAVSTGAAFAGQPELAVGNVVGSNICNILLILGLGALVAPLTVDTQVIRQEVPVMIGASLIMIAMGWNGMLGNIEGMILVALLAAYLTFLIRQSRRATQAEQAGYAEYEEQRAPAGGHWSRQVGLVVAGLALLVLGAHWLVDSAVFFARQLGVSDLVIGLTVVAVGTSLPEIATSVMAAIRGERDIAVGNAVGSNVFNLLGCLGVAAAVAPAGVPVAETALNFDVWVMLAVAVACLPVFFARMQIARWEGLLFLAYYVAYVAYLVLDAQGSAGAVKTLGTAIIGFLLPLTVITLAVLAVRHRRGGLAA